MRTIANSSVPTVTRSIVTPLTIILVIAFDKSSLMAMNLDEFVDIESGVVDDTVFIVVFVDVNYSSTSSLSVDEVDGGRFSG